MATMPHCDSSVLHAPKECEYCDAFPEFQTARRMWGIAFTGHRPKEGELPCPSEARRDLDTINRWPGNRPGNRATTVNTGGTTQHTVQLGRPNIPVLRQDLEELIREIIADVLREERGR